MKIKSILLLIVICQAMSVQSQEKKQIMNPFFESYSTPFQVPPFHLIENEHYKPAILEGIKQQEAEIKAIVSNKEQPNFENTILAMENSGKFLSKVRTVFSNMNSANTNDELQALAKELAPKLSAHSDNISLNEALFIRIKSVFDNQKKWKLSKEQAKILDNLFKYMTKSKIDCFPND